MQADVRSWFHEHLCVTFEMEDTDADAITDLMAGLFAEHDEVNDDELTPDVRSLFYEFERKKLFLIRRFEYPDEEGRTMRGFCWRFNLELEIPRAEAASPDPETSVYMDLPSTAWTRPQVAA